MSKNTTTTNTTNSNSTNSTIVLLEELTCPISLQRMKDPVVLFATGISYDKESLCRSLIEHPDLDPLTNQRFPGTILSYSDNVSLRSLLMKHFGSSAYQPFDDSTFVIQQQEQHMMIATGTFQKITTTSTSTTTTMMIMMQNHQIETLKRRLRDTEQRLASTTLLLQQAQDASRQQQQQEQVGTTNQRFESPPSLVLTGHTDAVRCLKIFSHENGTKLLLTGSWDNTLRVWDLVTGTVLQTWRGHSDWVQCCDVMDNLALSGGDDRTVRLWRIHGNDGNDDGSSSAAAAAVSVWINPRFVYGCKLFVYNGACMALTASCDNTLVVWDVATGRVQHVLRGHTDDVNCCDVTISGTRALSGSNDTTLRQWNLVTNECTCCMTGHDEFVSCCVAFGNNNNGNNNNMALSGSGDCTLRVWNVSTGQTQHVLRGHTQGVFCCCVFHDDLKALSGSSDERLIVWNLVNGQALQTLYGHTDSVSCCAILTTNTTDTNNVKVISGSLDKTLRVWDLFFE